MEMSYIHEKNYKNKLYNIRKKYLKFVSRERVVSKLFDKKLAY